MRLGESIRIAINAIRVNKMRSVLTMLGIIIGIASVIAVFAIGSGGEQAIGREFESFGVNRMMVFHSNDEVLSRKDLMTEDDVAMLQQQFSNKISAISPSFTTTMRVDQKVALRKEKGISVNLNGVYSVYNQIQKIDIVKGRFLRRDDMTGKRQVVVIDENLARTIFGTTEVLGEKIVLSNGPQRVSLTIVGIQEAPKDSLISRFSQTPNVYIPYSTMDRIVSLGGFVYYLEINTAENVDKEAFKKEIPEALAKRHHGKAANYMAFSAESEMAVVTSITGVITGIISAIAAVSLLVGGIGVMNIMLVSVTERTREIGIRKALGARRQDILLQFLVEAVIISLLGGIIGTIIGLGIAFFAAAQIGLQPGVSLGSIVLAWAFSAGVGIFFGLYPANKAAKLDPIDALRYE